MKAGNSLYECDIKMDVACEDGAVKTCKKKYLVESATPAEAERIATEEFAEVVRGEFEVTSVKKVEFADIIGVDNESAENWYSTKVNIINVDERTGKEKKTAQALIVRAKDFKDASQEVQDYVNGSICDMEIISLTKTKILDYINHE